MATLSADGHPFRRRMTVCAVAIGHYSGHAVYVMLAIGLARKGIHTLAGPGPTTTIATAIAQTAFWLTMASLCLSYLFHDRAVCTRDFSSRILGDPQGAVDRRRRELRAFHLPDLAKLVLTALLALWIFAVGDALERAEVWRTTALLADVAATLAIGYVWFAARTHKRLALWCPWCRDDGDGGGEPLAPVAPPDPAIRVDA